MTNNLGGKSFKLSSGPIVGLVSKVLPKNKQESEFLLSMMFAHFMLLNGEPILKLECNKDDSHGEADILLVKNDEAKGMQLTKISLNNPLQRKVEADKNSKELVELILKKITPKKPINITLYPPKDKIMPPRANRQTKEQLALFIANEINKNSISLFGQNPKEVICSVNDPKLNLLTGVILIEPIPKEHISTFIGHNNLFMNHEFNSHQYKSEDVLSEIDRIKEKKEKGNSEILLIWGERFELLYQDNEIAKVLIEKFKNTTFQEVYFLSFFDRQDLFLNSWRLYKVR